MTTETAELPTPARGSDYAVLSARVRQAGLLTRDPKSYLLRVAAAVTALVACWTVFALLGDSWWPLAVAVGLGVVFPQFAFLGHDAGHQQIFRTRRMNYLAGALFGNIAIGVDIGWWTSNHNRHHAHPNTDGADPDIMGILAHSQDRARAGRGIRRFIFRYQAWLFFPLLLLEGLSLRGAGVRHALRRATPRWRLELTLLSAHIVGYLCAVFSVLPVGTAVAFIAVHQGLFGLYMGCTFAPNHKGMEVIETPGSVDFLRRQVLTSRNVRGNWFTDLALGGLNYQIEHHLFPSMPRGNLRKVRPTVIAYCAEIGVPYRETGLLRSYSEALRYLDVVGRAAA